MFNWLKKLIRVLFLQSLRNFCLEVNSAAKLHMNTWRTNRFKWKCELCVQNISICFWKLNYRQTTKCCGKVMYSVVSIFLSVCLFTRRFTSNLLISDHSSSGPHPPSTCLNVFIERPSCLICFHWKTVCLQNHTIVSTCESIDLWGQSCKGT